MVLFPPPFYFVFYISNFLSYIKNNFSYELTRPIMGTIFLVIMYYREWLASLADYWQASEASETLYVHNYYILYIVRANFVLITRKEGGA